MTDLERNAFQLSRTRKTLQIVACDDDPAFLDKLRADVLLIFSRLNVDVCVSVHTSLADLSSQRLAECDIAFLDIDLNSSEVNGIDIARKLRSVNNRALIMFITNFIEYAPEGFEVQAFRYILKRDMGNVLQRYIMQALEQLSEGRETLRLQCRGEYVDLPFEGVLYLEVMQHSVSVVTADETYTVNASLSSFEQHLEKHGFLRVHKSYLVNMKHIRKFTCRELLLDNGSSLRVSEKNYMEQKQKYLLWKGWQ